MKAAALLTLLFFAVVYSGYSLLFYDLFSRCPWKFKFESETKCWVRDEKGGEVLVELFNASQDTNWLARSREDKVIWLQHPAGIVKSYNPHVPENEIKFSDDSLSSLTINGTSFTPKILGSRPPPGVNSVQH